MTDPPVMHLQNREGLLLWPYDEIAMLRRERSGRLEATSARGEVGHRPGPLEDFAGPPWVQVAPHVLVHPRHARKRGKSLVLPGGWRLPFDAALPRPVPPQREPVLPALGVRAGEVLYLKLKGRGASHWMTDRGRIPARGPAEEVAALHPFLLRMQGVYVNRRRIRAILHAVVPRLVLDDGTRIPLTIDWRPRVLAGLGVPDMRYVERLVPEQQGLYLFGLRDWPRLVRAAGADELEDMFAGDERALIANMVWQTRELRSQGCVLDDGTSHRGYWYNPLRPVLQRAGVPLEGAADEVVTLNAATRNDALLASAILPGDLDAASDDPTLIASVIPPGCDTDRYAPRRRAVRPGVDHYLYFITLLKTMVGTYRLLTYQELGFEEPRADLRVVGARRPGVVLVVEKQTVEHLARDLARRFGCSLVVTRGQPALLATEYFVRALRERHAGPVQLVAYVDFDAAGWTIVNGFREQLSRYGVETERVRYLVRPHRFTPGELRTLSYRLTSKRRSIRTVIARWVHESGGIDGRAAGIAADALRPVERLVSAFEEETGLTWVLRRRDEGAPSRRTERLTETHMKEVRR